MKKIALILVALLMTFACIAIAEEMPTVYTSGDYGYILLEDGTAEITEYRGDSSEVDIPEKMDGYMVTSIGKKAFFGCESLTEITIPDSVTSIGYDAFFGCESLTEITIPDSVTSIGDEAFFSCYSLTEITIPDSVTSIGNNPFGVCSKLTKIEVSPDHPTLEKIDGVLFDKKEKKLICYPSALTAESYSIPQGISSIGYFAFSGCESLTEIIIPDSVTSVGGFAFFGCESLTEITIPDSVTSIGDGAFYGCDSLTVTVERDSYVEQYARENNIEYTYTDATTNTDAGGVVEFEPVVIPLFEATLNEWYFDNYTRALFIAALATDLDYHLQTENKGTFSMGEAVFNSAYIGKSNFLLTVYMDDNTHQVIVTYSFLTDTASYMYADDISEIAVQLTLNDFCDSYHEIDSDDLVEAALDLIEAFE